VVLTVIPPVFYGPVIVSLTRMMRRTQFERSGHFRVTQTAPERLEHHESERNYE